jgi:hypothetical protein
LRNPPRLDLPFPRASQPVTTISRSWNAEASIAGRSVYHVLGRNASAEKWNTTGIDTMI